MQSREFSCVTREYPSQLVFNVRELTRLFPENVEPMNQPEKNAWLRTCEQANSQEAKDAWSLETEFRMNAGSGAINQYGYFIRICSACEGRQNSDIDGFLVLLEDAYDCPSLLPPYKDCEYDICECEYEDAYSPLANGTRIFEPRERAVIAKLKTNRNNRLSYKHQLRSRRGTSANASPPSSIQSKLQRPPKDSSKSVSPGVGCLALIVCVAGISLFSSMRDGKDFSTRQIDQQGKQSLVEQGVSNPTSNPPSSTKRAVDNRMVSYRILNHMDAVKRGGGRVSFSKKDSVIGIRQSATEISLSHIVTGRTMAVEKYENPFFAFDWSDEDKLITRGANALTENILLGANQTFGLAQLGESQVILLRLFPEVESLGAINEELSKIVSFSVNSNGSKIAYIRADGDVWLGEKQEAETGKSWTRISLVSSKDFGHK